MALSVARGRRHGFMLDPIDLAINKVLALAGRDEPRDFVDMLRCARHERRTPTPAGRHAPLCPSRAFAGRATRMLGSTPRDRARSGILSGRLWR